MLHLRKYEDQNPFRGLMKIIIMYMEDMYVYENMYTYVPFKISGSTLTTTKISCSIAGLSNIFLKIYPLLNRSTRNFCKKKQRN